MLSGLLVHKSPNRAIHHPDLVFGPSKDRLCASLCHSIFLEQLPTLPQSSSNSHWEPRRLIQPNDFQMDESRLFRSLNCLGHPFHVKMNKITHNVIPLTWRDISAIYGGKAGLVPKISSKKLETHGFDHWLTPNLEFHPFLPAQPGWPGLIFRLDEDIEEWRPKEGNEFRVVVRKEQHCYEYIGQYEMVRLDDITSDEWEQQLAEVTMVAHPMSFLGG